MPPTSCLRRQLCARASTQPQRCLQNHPSTASRGLSLHSSSSHLHRSSGSSVHTLTTRRNQHHPYQQHQHSTHPPRASPNLPQTSRSQSTNSSTKPSNRKRPRDPQPSAASAEALRSKGTDRGPASKEDTQTDFEALNVLGGTEIPATSVNVCTFDGFALDSGAIVREGDGLILVSGEAFVWRPWMAAAGPSPGAAKAAGSAGQGTAPMDEQGRRKGMIVTGKMLQERGATETDRSGGVLNAAGQFEIRDEAWGLLRMLYPKPDLLIIGTGGSIRPLAPSTRKYLQGLGMRLEILDTRNAASQFNMLAMERGVNEVVAALVPMGFGAKP